MRYTALLFNKPLKVFTMETKKETYMTVKDYADKFGMSLQTVYNKIKSKELETKKILSTTLVRV